MKKAHVLIFFSNNILNPSSVLILGCMNHL